MKYLIKGNNQTLCFVDRASRYDPCK